MPHPEPLCECLHMLVHALNMGRAAVNTTGFYRIRAMFRPGHEPNRGVDMEPVVCYTRHQSGAFVPDYFKEL
ncbi:MAG: hypothetical protein CM15mP21_7660 [Hyphomicrobiales bacterium]|nr:MAG: hypothetical protein CM15mP21_7660 [Hyphomicrobiales bacterium]